MDLRPMLLDEKLPAPYGEPGWIYEIKYDGYRLLALAHKGKAQLLTRNGADATRWFPEVTKGVSALPRGPHLLDGEVVVLDEDGRSDFERLQDRARRRRWVKGDDPVVFCAFDLLVRDGTSLVDLPIEERKAQLLELLDPMPDAVRYVEHFQADEGKRLYAAAKKAKLEGIVAKRLGSVYLPGERTTDWIKVKVPGAVPPERFKRPPRDPVT